MLLFRVFKQHEESPGQRSGYFPNVILRPKFSTFSSVVLLLPLLWNDLERQRALTRQHIVME
jgi:hypothetical protein